MNHFQLGLHVVSCCPTSHVVSCWLPFQNLFSFPCHSQSIFQLAQILMQNITPLTPTKGISVFGSSYFLPQKKQAFRSEALHSPTTSLDEQKYSASDCCVEDSWKHRNCLFLKYCECTTAKLSTWIYSKWAGTQVPTRKIPYKPPHWENKPPQCSNGEFPLQWKIFTMHLPDLPLRKETKPHWWFIWNYSLVGDHIRLFPALFSGRCKNWGQIWGTQWAGAKPNIHNFHHPIKPKLFNEKHERDVLLIGNQCSRHPPWHTFCWTLLGQSSKTNILKWPFYNGTICSMCMTKFTVYLW